MLALRGDPPGGPAAAWERHPEGLNYAADLVRLVASLGTFCVGVAAFPDVAPGQRRPRGRRAGARDEGGRRRGVRGHPVLLPSPSLLPARRAGPRPRLRHPDHPRDHAGDERQADQALRGAVRRAVAGATSPSGCRPSADDPAAVRAVGVELATELSSQLLDGGAPGLHFYTLNRSTATLEVFDRLGPERADVTVTEIGMTTHGVTVGGHGVARAAPQLARIRLRRRRRAGPGSTDALSATDGVVRRIREALDRFGVAREDAVTGWLSVQQIHHEGVYRCGHTIDVTRPRPDPGRRPAGRRRCSPAATARPWTASSSTSRTATRLATEARAAAWDDAHRARRGARRHTPAAGSARSRPSSRSSRRTARWRAR